MEQAENKAPSSKFSGSDKLMLDDAFGKEFLGSWKSLSGGDDDPIDFSFSVGTNGKKNVFDFGKLDMDFDLGTDIKNMKSFKLDLPGVDFEAPTNNAVKSRGATEASSFGTTKMRDSVSFSFDFNELDDFNFDSTLEKEIENSTKKNHNVGPFKIDFTDPEWTQAKNDDAEAQKHDVNSMPSVEENKAIPSETIAEDLEESTNLSDSGVPTHERVDSIISKEEAPRKNTFSSGDLREASGKTQSCSKDVPGKVCDQPLCGKDYKTDKYSDIPSSIEGTDFPNENGNEDLQLLSSDEVNITPKYLNSSMPMTQGSHKNRREGMNLRTAAEVEKSTEPALFDFVFQATPVETQTQVNDFGRSSFTLLPNNSRSEGSASIKAAEKKKETPVTFPNPADNPVERKHCVNTRDETQPLRLNRSSKLQQIVRSPRQDLGKSNEMIRVGENPLTPLSNKRIEKNYACLFEKTIGTNTCANTTTERARNGQIPKLKGFTVEFSKTKTLFSNLARLKPSGAVKTQAPSPNAKELQANGKSKTSHSSPKPPQAAESDAPCMKRKSLESLSAGVEPINPPKRLSTSPIWNLKNSTTVAGGGQIIDDSGETEDKAKDIQNSVANSVSETSGAYVEELRITPFVAEYGNVKQAEAYAKELDDLCGMLKKRLEEAKEVTVRAVVNNNSLLTLNHPSFNEKIGSLQKLAANLTASCQY